MYRWSHYFSWAHLRSYGPQYIFDRQVLDKKEEVSILSELSSKQRFTYYYITNLSHKVRSIIILVFFFLYFVLYFLFLSFFRSFFLLSSFFLFCSFFFLSSSFFLSFLFLFWYVFASIWYDTFISLPRLSPTTSFKVLKPPLFEICYFCHFVPPPLFNGTKMTIESHNFPITLYPGSPNCDHMLIMCLLRYITNNYTPVE